MIIQSSSNVVSAFLTTRISNVQRQAQAAEPATVADAVKISETEKNTGQVTLSSEGKALATAESKMTQSRTPVQDYILRMASNPEIAEQSAKSMAELPSTIFFDIRSWDAGPNNTKLSSTGRVVDDNFIDQFNSKAPAIDAQRLAIYRAEKAKGTDTVTILSKMIDFTNSQSKDYLEASGWWVSGSSSPA